MSQIIVAVAPSGELLTLRPVYFRNTSKDAFDNVGKFQIFVEISADEPVGYAVEHSQGGMMVGPGFLKLVEVLGWLE